MSGKFMTSMHIQKTMLFGKRSNAVRRFLFHFLVSLSISIFVGYYPVTSLNPPLLAKQLAPSDTIVDVLSKNGSFNTLVRALKAADLMKRLSSKDPYTIFAPIDAAFRELPPGTLDKLLNPANKDRLKKILTYHIVEGLFDSQKLKTKHLKTLEGKTVYIKAYSGRIIVNGAEVVTPNINAGNGVIHTIKKVISPPDSPL